MSDVKFGNKVFKTNGSIHDELEVLFEEAVDLANCLKSKARHTHRDEGLSASGRILLQSLHLKGPQTVPVLAHVRSTSRQNIQVLADRLAAAGYIEFLANPGHKRSDLVALTDAGRELLSSANEREAGLLATLLPHTTEAEVKAAADLLRKMRLVLGGERKRRTPVASPGPRPRSEPTVHPPELVPPAAPEPAPEAESDFPVSLL